MMENWTVPGMRGPVPRQRQEDVQRYLVPALQRKVERLETRIKLLEEEVRGGVNLSRFYVHEAQKKERPDG